MIYWDSSLNKMQSLLMSKRVSRKDHDCLNSKYYLGWEPELYGITSYLSGEVSPPSCANLAIWMTAKHNGSQFDTVIPQAVRRTVYNFISSIALKFKAVTVESYTTSIYGFHFTKWVGQQPYRTYLDWFHLKRVHLSEL